MKPFRILIISNHFYPYVGGLEGFVAKIAFALQKSGYEIEVLTFSHSQSLPQTEFWRNIKITRMPGRQLLSNLYSIPALWDSGFYKLIRDLSHLTFDLIITNTRFFLSSYIGLYLSRVIGCRLIHIEHGNRYVVHPNILVKTIAWVFDQTFSRFLFRSADATICISQAGVKFVKSLGAFKTDVVYNFVKTADVTQVLPDFPENDIFTIVFVGRLIYAKGVQVLIRALSGWHDVRLKVIGDGPYRGELERLAEALALNVEFTGELDQEDLFRHVRTCSLFVNPSFSEGLPTSVLEAGLLGLPVVATNVGGTGEIIENGVTGLLVRKNDVNSLREAIAYYKNNAKLRLSCARHLHEKVLGQFCEEKQMLKLNKIITQFTRPE